MCLWLIQKKKLRQWTPCIFEAHNKRKGLNSFLLTPEVQEHNALLPGKCNPFRQSTHSATKLLALFFRLRLASTRLDFHTGLAADFRGGSARFSIRWYTRILKFAISVRLYQYLHARVKLERDGGVAGDDFAYKMLIPSCISILFNITTVRVYRRFYFPIFSSLSNEILLLKLNAERSKRRGLRKQN